MDVVEKKELTPVGYTRTGDVFKYKGKYYMTTNAYFGQYTYPENKVYVDLETGMWKSFRYEKVELIKNAHLVIGEEDK